MTGDNASKMQLDAAVLGVGRERGARGSSVYWNVKIEALPLCFTKGWLAFGVDLGGCPPARLGETKLWRFGV